MSFASLVIGIKLLNVVPSMWLNLSSDKAAVLEADGNLERSALLVTLLSSLVGISGRFAGKKTAAAAAVGYAILALFLSPLMSQRPQFQVFAALHTLGFLLSSHAASKMMPQGRFKLLGTVLVQLVALVSLFVTIPALVVIVTLTGLSLVLFALISDRGNSHNDKGKESEINAKSNRKIALPFVSACFFLLTAFIGLNGEQIIDASFKVKLFRQKLDGNVWPMAAHHFLTIFARLGAFQSRNVVEPRRMILIWASVQILRLVVFSSFPNLNILLVALMIILDKSVGSLGEMALEETLLDYAKVSSSSSSSPGFLPVAFLVLLLQPLESITGGVVKSLVRSQNMFFHSFRPVIIVLLVLYSTLAVNWMQKKQKTSKKI